MLISSKFSWYLDGIKSRKFYSSGAREMAQMLRILLALLEELSLDPSTKIVRFLTTWTAAVGEMMAPSDFCGYLHAYGVHTYTQAYT